MLLISKQTGLSIRRRGSQSLRWSSQREAILRGLAVWDALTTLFVLPDMYYPAGGHWAWPSRVHCSYCSLLTLVCDGWIPTRWRDSIRWHQIYGDRVWIGSWEFVIPEAWYRKPVSGALVDMWRALGISEYVSLERGSLSITRERATIEIFTPAKTVTSSREGSQEHGARFSFQNTG